MRPRRGVPLVRQLLPSTPSSARSSSSSSSSSSSTRWAFAHAHRRSFATSFDVGSAIAARAAAVRAGAGTATASASAVSGTARGRTTAIRNAATPSHPALEAQSFSALRRAFLDELFSQKFKHQLKPLAILPVWARSRSIVQGEAVLCGIVTLPLVVITAAGAALYYASGAELPRAASGAAEEQTAGSHGGIVSRDDEEFLLLRGGGTTGTTQNRLSLLTATMCCNFALQYAWMLLVGRSALHYGLQLAEFAVPKTSTFAGQAFGFSRLLPPIGFFILGTGALTACCGGDQKFWQDANQLTLLAFAVQFWLYDFWNFHHAGVIPQYWARLCMAQTVVCGLCLHLVGHVMRGCKPEVVDFKIFPQGRGVGVGHHSAAAGGPDDPARRDLLLDDLGAAGLFQSLDRFLGISAAQFPGDEPPYKKVQNYQ